MDKTNIQDNANTAKHNPFIIKDSGDRTKFPSGAVRDLAEGKGRYDLIPAIAIKRLAQHYENGAKKYGENNWQKGIPLHNYLDSALRHLFQLTDGNMDEDHAAAVMWNIAGYIWTKDQMYKGCIVELDFSVDEVDIVPSQDKVLKIAIAKDDVYEVKGILCWKNKNIMDIIAWLTQPVWDGYYTGYIGTIHESVYNMLSKETKELITILEDITEIKIEVSENRKLPKGTYNTWHDTKRQSDRGTILQKDFDKIPLEQKEYTKIIPNK